MENKQKQSNDVPMPGPVPPPECGRVLSPIQTRYFYGVFILVVLLLGWVLSPFWQLLILGFLLAGIFRPVYSRLARWMPPWLASCLTCALIVVIVFVPLTFSIGALSSEALNVYHLGRNSNLLLKLQQFIQNNTLIARAQELLAGYGMNFDPAEVTGMVAELSKMAGLFVYSQASAWAANIMNFIFSFCILVLVDFFLLMEMDRLLAYLTRLSPLPDDQDAVLMNRFMEIAGVILVGNGISGVFQGILGGCYFAILGLKSPVLWGGVMAVLAFLPIFGIGLVLLPTAGILLVGGHWIQAIVTVAFYLLLSFSVEYIFKPKFVGSQVRMHTLLVFLAIIGGMRVFGVLGIIYGPLIVTAFLTLADIYLLEYKAFVRADGCSSGREQGRWTR